MAAGQGLGQMIGKTVNNNEWITKGRMTKWIPVILPFSGAYGT